MKHVLQYIAFIAFSFVCFANDAEFFDFDVSEYPNITAKFHYFDDSGKPTNNLELDDIRLFENLIQRDLTTLECNVNTEYHPVSVIIAFDASKNAFKSINEYKKLLESFFLMDFAFKNEYALLSVNKNISILQDFTLNRQESNESIEKIQFNDFINLDSLFSGYYNGIENITSSAKYPVHLVMMSSNYNKFDTNEAQNHFNNSNITPHLISISGKVDNQLSRLIARNGGEIISLVEKFDSKSASIILARKIQGILPCNFTWVSGGCDTILNMEVSIPGETEKKEARIIVSKDKLPYIEFDPPVLEFGIVPKDETRFKEIKLTARNGDIMISNHQSSDTRFLVESYGGPPPDFIIREDSSRIFTIKYSASDTLYYFGRIDLVTDACIGKSILMTAGSYNVSAGKPLLSVNNPGPGDCFAAGADTIITWGGISHIDSVNILYSSDGGNDWSVIAENVTGNRFNWRIPLVNSDNNLIKVQQVAKEWGRDKILFLAQHGGPVTGISWSPLGTAIATVSEDDSLKVWESSTGALLQGIKDNNLRLNKIDWSPDMGEYKLTVVDKNYLVVWINDRKDSLTGRHGQFVSAEWSPGGGEELYAAGGTEDGYLYVWEYFGSQQAPDEIAIFESGVAIRCLDWSRFSDHVILGDNLGRIRKYNPSTDEITELAEISGAVNSLDYNKDNSLLATGGNNNELKIWNTSSNQVIKTLIVEETPVGEVEWDPSGRFIAAAAGDDVYLWNVNDWSEYYVYRVHNSTIGSISWKRDGNLIATGDFNGEAHIWDPDDIPFEKSIVQQDDSELFCTMIPDVAVKSVVFTPTLLGKQKDSLIIDFFINNSDFKFRIDSIILPNPSEFKIPDLEYPIEIEPQGSLDLNFSFRPTLPSIFETDITIVTQIGDLISKNRGRGFLPGLELSERNIDFGDALIWDESIEHILTIKNITDDAFVIRNLNISGVDNSQFMLETEINDSLINPQQEFGIKLKFVPDSKGRTNSRLLIRYREVDSLETVYLYGRGTAPDITHEDVLIEPFKCRGDIRDTILNIRNNGTGELKISDLLLNSEDADDFKVNIINGNNIPPGDTLKLNIGFTPQNTGVKYSEIIIKHNLDFSLKDSTTIKVFAALDSTELALSNTIIRFEDIAPNVEEVQEIYLLNLGDYSVEWFPPVDLDFAVIESIEPQITPPNDSSLVTVRFLGAEENKLFDTTYTFLDDCNNEATLSIIANTGINDAQISSDASVNFNTVVCDETSKFALDIENSGSTPLVIANYYFEGGNFNDFETCESVTEILVPAGLSEMIELCFTPSSPGEKLSDFVLVTNAKNALDGKYKIPVSGKKELVALRMGKDTLHFDVLFSQTAQTDSIAIINIGSIASIINFEDKQGDKFNIKSIFPPETGPDESSTMIIEFEGGDEGEHYEGMVQVIDRCGFKLPLYLVADVRGDRFITLEPKSFDADAGETKQLIITIDNPKSLDLSGIDSVTATLIYDATLIVPLEGFTKDTVINEIRYTDISIGNDQVQNGYSMPVLITLGRTDSTDLKIKSTTIHGDGSIYPLTSDGQFILTGVCIEALPRFIGDAGLFFLEQNVPNPAENSTKITFRLIEKSSATLELYDLYGRKLELMFEAIGPGEFEHVLDLKTYPAGTYFYILRTESSFELRKMTVFR